MDSKQLMAQLCGELKTWTSEQGLPLASADEIPHMADVTHEQRVWLREYCQRWDAAVELERNERSPHDMTPSPATAITAERLAEEFAAVLLVSIGPDNMREVIARNQSAADPMTCASHDFCDANMLMFKALQNLTDKPLDPETICADSANADLWNRAWAIAKESAMQSMLQDPYLPTERQT